jgi:hypothetical protein
MIYLYDTGRGVISTNEVGAKQIEDAITKGIEEFLTTLHNEPELEVIKDELGWSSGILHQMENATSYTYSILTKEKFEEWLKELYA